MKVRLPDYRKRQSTPAELESSIKNSKKKMAIFFTKENLQLSVPLIGICTVYGERRCLSVARDSCATGGELSIW